MKARIASKIVIIGLSVLWFIAAAGKDDVVAMMVSAGIIAIMSDSICST